MERTERGAMHFDLTGPAGRLEALLDEPEQDRTNSAVVLAHPHPEHGGSMRSRVLHEAARGFREAGFAVLRFNLRGVGSSAGTFTGGEAEVADFETALAVMRARFPDLPLWAAGYSFGAWIAAKAAADDAGVAGLIAIAPPVNAHSFSALEDSAVPKFLIAAERDELTSWKEMQRFYARLAEPRELLVIDGANHAFDGKASEVGDAIRDLLE